MTKKIDKDKDILSIEIECPFCKEKDFDLIGLKSHFWQVIVKYSKILRIFLELSGKIKSHPECALWIGRNPSRGVDGNLKSQ